MRNNNNIVLHVRSKNIDYYLSHSAVTDDVAFKPILNAKYLFKLNEKL